MNMNRYIRLVALAGALVLWLGMGTEAHAAEQKTGWIKAQRVLDETRAGRDIKSRIEAFVSSRQKIIDLEEEELANIEKKLQEQMALLSEQAKREKEASFRKKLLKLNEKASELTREIEEKKVELLNEFNDTLTAAVKKVADEGGYSFVLAHGQDGSILYGAKEYDLTDKVMAEIDGRGR